MAQFLLNVALLVIGTVATLAAFGGKTWHEQDNSPLIERINTRGWLSLGCLLLALVLGILKEIGARKETSAKDESASREQAALNARLARTQADLDVANRNLFKLEQRLILAQSRLDDAKTSLGDLRSNLDYTRNELTESSVSSSITALLNSNQQVKMVGLVVPLVGTGPHSDGIRSVFLPNFDNSECQDLTAVEMAVTTSQLHSIVFSTDAEDTEASRPVVNASGGRVDGVQPAAGYSSSISSLFGTKINYSHVYMAAMISPHLGSAADLYAAIMNFSGSAVNFSWRWPKSFHSVSALEAAGRKYPGLNLMPSANTVDGYGRVSEVVVKAMSGAQYPAPCSKALAEHLKSTFSSAMLMVVLDQKQNEALLFKLQAAPPKIVSGRWTLSLRNSGTPIVAPVGELVQAVVAESRDKAK